MWRDHGLPWPVHEMTNEQYLMIATHKLLDDLERNNTPYKRESKKEKEIFEQQIENIRNLSKQIKEKNEAEKLNEHIESIKNEDISSKFDWKKTLMEKVKEENAN